MVGLDGGRVDRWLARLLVVTIRHCPYYVLYGLCCMAGQRERERERQRDDLNLSTAADSGQININRRMKLNTLE